MNGFAQLRHVFVKDVLEHRWLLALYVAVVFIAMGHALEWRALAAPVLGGTMMIVGLVGILLVASVVQGDSPTRSDAFWVSHPLEPLPVLSAKVVLALLVLAVAVAGQAIVIGSYHPARGDTVRLLVHPSVSFATFLLAAMAVASLTRDLRSFALVAIVVPVLLIVTATVVAAFASSSFAVSFGSGGIRTARWLALLVAAAIIVWLYRTRDARWRTRIVGYLAAGVAVVMTLMTAMEASTLPPRSNVPRIPLALEENSLNIPGNPDKLTLALVVPDLPQGYLFGLRGPVATIRFADGSTTKVLLGYGYLDLSDTPFSPMPVIPGIRWRAPARDHVRRIQVAGELTPTQRAAIDAGGATVTVAAHVDVDTLRAEESTTLATGAEMTRDGRRTRIERWDRGSGVPDLVVHSANVAGDEARGPSFGTGFLTGIEYALINRRRGEAIPLGHTEMGSGLDGLVLPGSTLSSATIRYSGRIGLDMRRDLPDDDWYRGAELLAITREPLGSYPVALRLAIPAR